MICCVVACRVALCWHVALGCLVLLQVVSCCVVRSCYVVLC